MIEERLFRLAVESGAVAFNHVAGQGWMLSVGVRRGDESWREVKPDLYERLTTVELLQVISSTLDAAL